jgi:hypothetical protein
MGLMTILCGPRALHLWERVTSRGLDEGSMREQAQEQTKPGTSACLKKQTVSSIFHLN